MKQFQTFKDALLDTQNTAVLRASQDESSPMRSNTHPGGPHNDTPEMPHTPALSNRKGRQKRIWLSSLTLTQKLFSLPLSCQPPYLTLTLQTGFGTARKTKPANLVINCDEIRHSLITRSPPTWLNYLTNHQAQASGWTGVRLAHYSGSFPGQPI